MTVGELIEELKYVNEDCEVRFASQPSWPFEYSIYGARQCTIEERGEDTHRVDVVYLEEGRQIGYLPGEAKNELGW